MALVELKNMTKVYPGGVRAVESANITVNDQEFLVLVGPSGCGKTTTLRMIAGLEEITEGDLFIDGKQMNNVAPKDRDIAMVFQNYALYPHMTVYNNMAFGLKIRKFPKEEVKKRVQDSARILDIEELLERKPKALSGGQRQRVAVGRAIVRKPKVFLFDEPLSNLDAKLRVQMRAELSALHHRLKATIVYVTHDQIEAMTMGDTIVVLKDGVIQQIGAPLELYNFPVNRFVAGFIGSPPMNIFAASVKEESGKVFIDEGDFQIVPKGSDAENLRPYIGKQVQLGLRPEDLSYMETPAKENSITTRIDVVEPLGAETHLHVSTKETQMVVRADSKDEYKVADEAHLKPNVEKMKLFDMDTEEVIG